MSRPALPLVAGGALADTPAMPRPRLLAFAALLLFAACMPAEQPAAAPAEPRPALWKLADEDTTIWLFGTIHVLPTGYRWETPVIVAAAAASDTLVIETVLGDDPAATIALLARLGASPGLPPLRERVPAEKRATLDAVVARSGFPPAALDALETWAAALALVRVMLLDLELDPANGVEEALQKRFAAANKPIAGLETPEAQLSVLDGLDEESQRAFLVALLDDPATVKREYAAMLDAWGRGDPKAVAATFDAEAEVSPALREALLRRRNAAWTEWLAKRLERPGTVFLAVGAGHLAGPDSVIEMLQARATPAVRVQ